MNKRLNGPACWQLAWRTLKSYHENLSERMDVGFESCSLSFLSFTFWYSDTPSPTQMLWPAAEGHDAVFFTPTVLLLSYILPSRNVRPWPWPIQWLDDSSNTTHITRNYVIAKWTSTLNLTNADPLPALPLELAYEGWVMTLPCDLHSSKILLVCHGLDMVKNIALFRDTAYNSYRKQVLRWPQHLTHMSGSQCMCLSSTWYPRSANSTEMVRGQEG